MKKLAISTLAVLIACPAFAGHPQNGSSLQMWGLDPYIALRGGIAHTDTNYRFLGHKEAITDTTFQGRVAMGLQMNHQYRSEIEWSIYSKSKDSSTFGLPNDVEVTTKLQTLQMNAFMDVCTNATVRPVIGLGAGAGFADIKRTGSTIASHSNNKAGFSATGIMGMTFDMDMFALDVAARYTYVDVQSGLHNFGADIGLRFMF